MPIPKLSQRHLFQWMVLQILLVLSSCQTPMPKVSLPPNDSGIECSEFRLVPPFNRMGTYKGKPDVPPSLVAVIKRQAAIKTPAGGYMLAPAGRLHVLSLGHPRSFPGSIKWRNSLLLMLDELPGKDGAHFQVPELPWMNAGQMFHAKIRTVKFPWGTGILFMTAYAQGRMGGPVNNDSLVLNLQAITHDHKHAITDSLLSAIPVFQIRRMLNQEPTGCSLISMTKASVPRRG